MKLTKYLFVFLCLGITFVLYAAEPVSAQSKTVQPQISFDSFTGIYHLSRDKKGLSLLTTEETILADFPGNGAFYGITRSIPKNFLNHAVGIKVLGVADAAGNIIPYKTAKDKNNNLVITTGDPNIILYGSQTIKIRYQTSGVIDLDKKNDEFLLNVNGRGWNQSFSRVNAALYIPNVFGGSLIGDPVCYAAMGDSKNNHCQINTKKNNAETIITTKAENLIPHQALVLKLNFKSSTFTNNRDLSNNKKILISAGLIAMGCICFYFYKTSKKSID